MAALLLSSRPRPVAGLPGAAGREGDRGDHYQHGQGELPGEPVLGTAARPAAMPMDAWQQGDNFYICLDLPGINPDSIDLTVEQNVLTVRAERAPVQADGAQMIVAERPHGTFTRQVFLGQSLDAENITADYAAGVLTLTIPVHEAAKPRTIQVTSSDTKQAVTA